MNNNYQNLPALLKENGSNLTFTYNLESYNNVNNVYKGIIK